MRSAYSAGDNSDDLLTFVKSAGSVVLGLLDKKQQYRAGPAFATVPADKAQGLQRDLPLMQCHRSTAI